MYSRTLSLSLSCLMAVAGVCNAYDYHVSTAGSDTNPGTAAQPWRTINFAVAVVTTPGDTINVHTGVYAERVICSGKSGTAAQPLTLRNAAGEAAVIDLTGITPPNGDAGGLEIVNCSYFIVQGLEIRNFSTSSTSKNPTGIYVYGGGTGVKLLGNKVHDIQQNNSSGGNGFGISVKGTSATAIDQFVLDGNEVYNLKTGSSESVTLNGNVTNFTVTNNTIHDCNNIGIDFIGYEGANSNSALDRARLGVCSGNTIYNIDSKTNPAYGGDRAAPGIYVDGGQSVVIERNLVHHCNYGISVGSEHAGRYSDSVTVRSNIVRQCHVGGIVLGGATAASNGGATNVTVNNNTVYQNDTDFMGGGCLEIQNNVSTTSVRNNIFVCSVDGTGFGQFILKSNTNGSFASGAINWNLYTGVSSLSGGYEFIWNGTSKSSFSSWKSSSGQDANSTFTTGSLGLANAPAGDFDLLSTSVARDAGDPSVVSATGELDFGGQSRVANNRVDLGADEFEVALSSNANLASLVSSAGTLTPAFIAGTTSYSAIVAEGTSSLTVTPASAESHATIRVNGTIVATGTPSGAIPLSVGSGNVITIAVTAQDGVTMVTYTLTVTRPQGVVDISVEQPVGTGVIDGSSVADYGTVFLSSTASLTFTVRCMGTDPLTGISVGKDGPDAGMFTIDAASLPATLQPGTSGTFTVAFTPTSDGAKSAAIHIASSDPDENPFDIMLSGTGADPLAHMISPVDGSTLTGVSTTFTWSAGAGASGYALWIGSSLDGYDLYAAVEGTGLSRTVTLPADGRVVYVKLWSLVNGVYQGITYTYTTPRNTKARVTSPVNGSTLGSSSLTLTWDSGVGVSQIVLWAGTTVDGYDLYAAAESGNSRTITIPPGGGKVYVTLWSLIAGTYQPNRYVFTAQAPAKAALSSPGSGSTLTDGTLALSWNGGIGVSQYAVWVGSAYGGYDLGAANAGTATTSSFNVPQDGGPVYVTLWSLINGGWQSSNYWFFTAPNASPRGAVLTSPANTAALSSQSVTFTWDSAVGATNYALWVGSAADGYDLYAAYEATSSRTITVPGDGRRIFVTLHSLINGAWQSNSYWFTCASLPDAGAAHVTSPAQGSTLAGNSLPLTWDSAAGASSYAIWVGSSPGAYDLYASLLGTAPAATVTVPVDGRPVYVTLWSLINGSYKPSSTWFTTANTASGDKRSLMASPVNDSTLNAATTTFTWATGTGTSQALWIGSSPGAYDLWASAETASATSHTLTLPTDGRKIHVTLWSLLGSAWQSASYVYTAANIANTAAAITSPAAGTPLPGASVSFFWSAGTNATAYALWIGRTPGGYDVYAASEGANLSRTINTIPADGGPVYVTLWSLINGTWQSHAYIYDAAINP